MEFNTEKELEKFIDSWTDVLDQGLKTQRGLLESIDLDVIPLYEEHEYKEGLKKAKKIQKLLQKNLEK